MVELVTWRIIERRVVILCCCCWRWWLTG